MRRLFSLLVLAMASVLTATAAKNVWKAKHVLLIGIDGWGAYLLPAKSGKPMTRKRTLYI